MVGVTMTMMATVALTVTVMVMVAGDSFTLKLNLYDSKTRS